MNKELVKDMILMIWTAYLTILFMACVDKILPVVPIIKIILYLLAGWFEIMLIGRLRKK